MSADSLLAIGRAPVGQLLQSARVSKGVSLDELSRQADVPLRHLQAIEAGDYSGFGTPLYATAYARACAAALGISEAWIDGRLRAEMNPALTSAPATCSPRAARGKRMFTGGLIGAAIVALILMLV